MGGSQFDTRVKEEIRARTGTDVGPIKRALSGAQLDELVDVALRPGLAAVSCVEPEFASVHESPRLQLGTREGKSAPWYSFEGVGVAISRFTDAFE